MIKYLIFDFDGTLYDKKKIALQDLNFYKKLEYVASKLNLSIEETHKLAVSYYEKYGSSWYSFEKLHNIPVIQSGNDFEFPPIEKNLKLRKILESIDIKKAIFTNAQKTYLNRALNALGLENLFEKMITFESIKIPPKPHKEAYENLIKILNVKPQECIFFDDANMNLKAAKQFGINTVLCDATDKSKSEFIDYKISSLEDELVNAIKYFT